MIAEVEIAEIGQRLQLAGIPVHFADTPGKVRVAGPGLDAHREEILRQFGL